MLSLLDTIYPGTTSILAETVLGNDVIEGLATCRERIDSHTEMCHRVQWAIGYDANTGLSTLDYQHRMATCCSESSKPSMPNSTRMLLQTKNT
jgi:hypothetical protein